MKFAFTLIFCLVFLNIPFSQTSIGLIIGEDYMDMKPGLLSAGSQRKFQIKYDDNKINSITWGGTIEHRLSSKAYLSLSVIFSKKSFTTAVAGYASLIFDETQFGHQVYSISFYRSPFRNFYIGFGGTYSLFNNFHGNGWYPGAKFKSEYGGMLGAAYRYGGFALHLQYLYSLDVKELDGDELLFLSPTKSIILSLSYVVEIIAPRK
ncbi:MAG: hypothetical protein MK226_15385 [Saprospiraceae bacterium]|nr:hypothetical protein [Saprospiraceae bacterium]